MHSNSFVTREGSRLMHGGKPFRFAGPNIYWLGLDENVGGVDWPTEYRVVNALDTALEMGANVVRSHTLGASHGHPKAIMPEPGVFNEEALRRIDFAIHEAGKRGLKLIIPFVCNWDYYHGGRLTFARWEGSDNAEDFYRLPGCINLFKLHIAAIINRVNTLTGITYKNDPTILAWELGNELNDAPAAWVEEIADYIKGLDGNHLVAHGKQFGLDRDKLAIGSLDILDVHYYPANAEETVADAREVDQAGKVYIQGEYGWPDADLDSFLAAAEGEPTVAGTLFWSLFPHGDNGGYVQHFDGFSVQYPGTAFNGELTSRIGKLREHLFRMRGLDVPGHSIPREPEILSAEGAVRFKGVVGGASYTLERSFEGEGGPWTTVYDRRPADYAESWIDPTRIHTKPAYYRVRAHNVDGAAGGYSAVYRSDPFNP
ncbi:glycoside hydrolase 5 family protein [Paenibacillus soyae]|uniref:mannan endo-1,4-beta-mannosidase n=1 Tax=Paenibacillus soyae TaxID=2969249 RepID=A0A9X2MQP7_9BACL|nr:cellulase family glycosylhydrolase [Paenibacillus soyae]MCR2804640.1 cellulase family glycosylhydrolase [Paenibacillus soyae]